MRWKSASVLAPAVLLLVVSNHFPLVYGTSRPWLVAPMLIVLACAIGLSLRWLSLRSGRPTTA